MKFKDALQELYKGNKIKTVKRDLVNGDVYYTLSSPTRVSQYDMKGRMLYPYVSFESRHILVEDWEVINDNQTY